MDIKNAVRMQLPNLSSENFAEKIGFEIGFINPYHVDFQDGIANDETIFYAESLSELDALYTDFCKEMKIPVNTVTYVNTTTECPDYSVCMKVSGYINIDVAARDYAEAKRRAEEMFSETYFSNLIDVTGEVLSIEDEHGNTRYSKD